MGTQLGIRLLCVVWAFLVSFAVTAVSKSELPVVHGVHLRGVSKVESCGTEMQPAAVQVNIGDVIRTGCDEAKEERFTGWSRGATSSLFSNDLAGYRVPLVESCILTSIQIQTSNRSLILRI